MYCILILDSLHYKKKLIIASLHLKYKLNLSLMERKKIDKNYLKYLLEIYFAKSFLNY